MTHSVSDLVESRRAIDAARAVQRRSAVTAAALLLLLTTPNTEVSS